MRTQLRACGFVLSVLQGVILYMRLALLLSRTRGPSYLGCSVWKRVFLPAPCEPSCSPVTVLLARASPWGACTLGAPTAFLLHCALCCKAHQTVSHLRTCTCFHLSKFHSVLSSVSLTYRIASWLCSEHRPTLKAASLPAANATGASHLRRRFHHPISLSVSCHGAPFSAHLGTFY